MTVAVRKHRTEKRDDGYTYCRLCGMRAWDPTFLAEMECTASARALAADVAEHQTVETRFVVDYHVKYREPVKPMPGQLWYDKLRDQMYVYTDMGWEDPAQPSVKHFGPAPLVTSPVPWAQIVGTRLAVTDSIVALGYDLPAVSRKLAEQLRHALDTKNMIQVNRATVRTHDIPASGTREYVVDVDAVPWPRERYPVDLYHRPVRGLGPGDVGDPEPSASIMRGMTASSGAAIEAEEKAVMEKIRKALLAKPAPGSGLEELLKPNPEIEIKVDPKKFEPPSLSEQLKQAKMLDEAIRMMGKRHL